MLSIRLRSSSGAHYQPSIGMSQYDLRATTDVLTVTEQPKSPFQQRVLLVFPLRFKQSQLWSLQIS